MKAKKIKRLVRLGQMAYFGYIVAYAFFERQLPNYVPIEFSGTSMEMFWMICCLLDMIILTEVIVRVIGAFAEILEEKNK